MRDISNKATSARVATASARLALRPETLSAVREGRVPKGNPLEVAKVAAVQAAKQTSSLIPYCHPLPVDFVGVEYELSEAAIEVTVTVKAIYATGVEMEALCGASTAALTLYDMLKMLDDSMEIRNVRLVAKKGGKSDFSKRPARKLSAAVLVVSDAVTNGKKDDRAGRTVRQRLESEGIEIIEYRIVPEEHGTVVDSLTEFADRVGVDLVITTGGTSFSANDITPEATAEVIQREIPGIGEALRAYGQKRTPLAMLARGKSGVRGKTVIVNLPGSSRGAAESLDALFPGLLHSFRMLRGDSHAGGYKEKD